MIMEYIMVIKRFISNIRDRGREVKISKLTKEEIMELDLAAAQRMAGENINNLIEIESKLFEAVRKLGEAKIEVEKNKIDVENLKNQKTIIIEINRSLKTVISGG